MTNILKQIIFGTALATALFNPFTQVGNTEELNKNFQSSMYIEERVITADLIKRIIEVESQGNPRAYNQRSRARGLMQIIPIALKEYNLHNPTERHSLNDLFNPEINKKVGKWGLYRIKNYYLSVYKLPPTVENILAAYNMGPPSLNKIGDAKKNFTRLPRQTRTYITKITQKK
ncbi:MAG: lytic transglycosylase domain-containing protein [Nanoarchaeota archaeon]|nr:lytic transglycosylase domain-containing protein [Nanoarchaeota archaeon]